MFRVSIRELMLVTLVVALAVGWAIEHWRPSNIYRKMDLENIVMKEGLKFLGYEVKEEWPGFVIHRNSERPWTINTEQRPGEVLVGGVTLNDLLGKSAARSFAANIPPYTAVEKGVWLGATSRYCR